MLAKLSIANVRRSYKDFAIYFFTLLIGVAVFYAFNSITAQDAVLAFDKSQGNMIELLGILDRWGFGIHLRYFGFFGWCMPAVIS